MRGEGSEVTLVPALGLTGRQRNAGVNSSPCALMVKCALGHETKARASSAWLGEWEVIQEGWLSRVPKPNEVGKGLTVRRNSRGQSLRHETSQCATRGETGRAVPCQATHKSFRQFHPYPAPLTSSRKDPG